MHAQGLHAASHQQHCSVLDFKFSVALGSRMQLQQQPCSTHGAGRQGSLGAEPSWCSSGVRRGAAGGTAVCTRRGTWSCNSKQQWAVNLTFLPPAPLLWGASERCNGAEGALRCWDGSGAQINTSRAFFPCCACTNISMEIRTFEASLAEHENCSSAAKADKQQQISGAATENIYPNSLCLFGSVCTFLQTELSKGEPLLPTKETLSIPLCQSADGGTAERCKSRSQFLYKLSANPGGGNCGGEAEGFTVSQLKG